MKFFLRSSSLHEWKIRSCHPTWQSTDMTFISISIISIIFTFSLIERTSRLFLGLETLAGSLQLRFWTIITVNNGFLNTNTTITRQLIRTARTLEAEWWQVCRQAWVRGQREISQILGSLGLMDFIILGTVLAWRAFRNL